MLLSFTIIINNINVIALSKQLVHFLMVWKPSEVVFASKSSFYPAIHWDLSDIIIFFTHILLIYSKNKHTNVYFYYAHSRCIVCYYPLPLTRISNKGDILLCGKLHIYKPCCNVFLYQLINKKRSRRKGVTLSVDKVGSCLLHFTFS